LGVARAAADQVDIQLDEVAILAATAVDEAGSTLSAPEYNGLQTLDDYTLLYDGHWTETLPKGPVPGMLTNYTQDLLFSMERLSFSPYQVRRLNPSAGDTLPFPVVTSNLNLTAAGGMTLQQLFDAGRLFYSDYRDQKNLTSTGRYAGACDAYFYIDPKTDEFLPLAIRTNSGSTSVVYTSQDSASDWLLAKMMYNVDDFWFAQWNHLASTHEVVQIAYLAAIRTLSDDHPVLAVLNRVMYEVYAIQPLAALLLFAPGAAVDQVFAYTGASAQEYTTNMYQNGGRGRFQANYFEAELESRGLINSDFGPALKNFPFYEDASTIYTAIHAFMTSFVGSYYAQDSDVAADTEIQAWVKDAQGPAEAIDFPNLTTKSALVDALTHMVSKRSFLPNSTREKRVLLTTQPTRLISPRPPTTRSTPTSCSRPVPRCPSTLLRSTSRLPPRKGMSVSSTSCLRSTRSKSSSASPPCSAAPSSSAPTAP
jgi:hypothetical protein